MWAARREGGLLSLVAACGQQAGAAWQAVRGVHRQRAGDEVAAAKVGHSVLQLASKHISLQEKPCCGSVGPTNKSCRAGAPLRLPPRSSPVPPQRERRKQRRKQNRELRERVSVGAFGWQWSHGHDAGTQVRRSNQFPALVHAP